MEGRNGYSCGCYPGWGGRDCVDGKSIQKLPSVVIEEICCCNFSVSRLNLYLFYNFDSRAETGYEEAREEFAEKENELLSKEKLMEMLRRLLE